MATKHQKVTIKVPKALSKAQRIALGVGVIDYIVERSEAGKDKRGNDFPRHKKSPGNPSSGRYSKRYAESLDFKNAGKSKNKISMTLSGNMLAAIEILKTSKGEITIGYKKGSNENAKADGNIRGTYGNSKPVQRKRDFLGISREALDSILDRFKDDKGKLKEEAIIKAVPGIVQTLKENKKVLKKDGKETEFNAINLNLTLAELETIEKRLKKNVS